MNKRVRSSTILSILLILSFVMPVSAVVINGFEGTAGNAIDWQTQESIDGNADYSFDATSAYVTEGTQCVHRSNIIGYQETLALKLDAAQRADFMANDVFSIDIAVPANTDANGGWIELNQVALNIDGYGYVGQFASAPAFFGYWAGSPVQKKSIVVDYRSQKASMPANPSFIEIVFITNSDGTRTDMYFDNAQVRKLPSAVYEYEVLADSPWGWIRFEDSNSKSGSSFPFSQPGHTQTYKYVWRSGSISLVDSRTGLGSAAQFDGSVVSSAVGFTPFDPNHLSVELWMKANVQQPYAPLAQMTQYNAGKNFSIKVHNDGSLFVEGGGQTWYGASGGNVVDDQWHHVVVTYEQVGANLKKQCFIDGVLKGSTTHNGTSLEITNNILTLGADGAEWGAWNYYKGAMDEVAFYDSVLSAERVAAHFNAASIPTPTTCDEVQNLGWGLTADLNKDCTVNLGDFAEVASTWLLCNDPTLFGTDPTCVSTW
jgi:hypothetical protein